MGSFPDEVYVGIPKNHQEKGSSQLFQLKHPLDQTAQLLAGLIKEDLPELDGKRIDEQTELILNEFKESVTLDQLIASPPPILSSLIQLIHQIYPAELFESILALWPPTFPIQNPAQRALLLYFISLIPQFEADKAFIFIQWLSLILPPKGWYGESSAVSNDLKAICRFRNNKKDKPLWALVDNENVMTVYDASLNEISRGTITRKDLIPPCQIKFTSDCSNHPKVITLFDENTAELFSANNTPLPVMLSHLGELIPPIPGKPNPKKQYSVPTLLPSITYLVLYQILTAPDMRIIHTISHYTVTKISEIGIQMAECLLDIFAHAGKVNQLLVSITGYEFREPTLTPDTVLRSNSFLTCMFKVYYDRYGRLFYERFLKHCIEYVDASGDIQIQANQDPEGRAKTLLFTVLKAFMSSRGAISPEMRHLGQILKLIVASRFNDFGATYNTIVGFYCLRFFNAIFSSPTGFDSTLHLQHRETLIPFSQLLQLVFNRMPLTGKWEGYSSWNNRLEHHTFPQMTNFILSLCDIGSDSPKPNYKYPDDERLGYCLQFVMESINKVPKPFTEQYTNTESSLWKPVNWNLSSFFLSFFKETRVDLNMKQNPNEEK